MAIWRHNDGIGVGPTGRGFQPRLRADATLKGYNGDGKMISLTTNMLRKELGKKGGIVAFFDHFRSSAD